jgi:hypothetical protein
MTVLECFDFYTAQRTPEDLMLASLAAIPADGALLSTLIVFEFTVAAKTGALCPADEAVVVASLTGHGGGVE